MALYDAKSGSLTHKASGTNTKFGFLYIDVTPVGEWRTFQELPEETLGTTRVTESDQSTLAYGGHKFAVYLTPVP
jgi:hypothetical protein